MDELDLNVMAPHEVARQLRRAAQAYFASAGELSDAWQDESAGLVWIDLARILERAATQCERAVAKRIGVKP